MSVPLILILNFWDKWLKIEKLEKTGIFLIQIWQYGFASKSLIGGCENAFVLNW